MLVIGRIGEDVAALALTTRERRDRDHHPLGVWDPGDGRPSWVRLDRVLRLDPQGVRREGATLDRERQLIEDYVAMVDKMMDGLPTIDFWEKLEAVR